MLTTTSTADANVSGYIMLCYHNVEFCTCAPSTCMGGLNPEVSPRELFIFLGYFAKWTWRPPREFFFIVSRLVWGHPRASGFCFCSLSGPERHLVFGRPRRHALPFLPICLPACLPAHEQMLDACCTSRNACNRQRQAARVCGQMLWAAFELEKSCSTHVFR